MKNLRFVGFATLCSFAAAGLVLVACSDDTSVPTPSEAGVDGSTDAPTGDSAIDSGDANVDAGLKPETFTGDLGNALCDTLSRCCYGGASDGGAVDGGTFDRSTCLSDSVKIGFEGSLQGFNGAASNADIDQVAGADCLKKIRALSCDLEGPEFQAARTACFNAIKGRATAGQDCQSAVDCATGNYCNGADAGPGKCAALKGSGGNCGGFQTGTEDKDFLVSDLACSWRGGGDPKLFCLQGPLDGGPVLPKTEWTCSAARANGDECANSLWCASGICNVADSKCTSPIGVFPQSACGSYLKP